MSVDELLEFPCDFPLKVMGRDTREFREAAIGIAATHFGVLETSRIGERVSRNGRFVSLTITVRAESRAQLDAAYCELSASNEVLWLL